jgi:hypothetical protein
MSEQIMATGFVGSRRFAGGPLAAVAAAAKPLAEAGETVAIFDDGTGRPIDVDFRGSAAEIAARLAAPAEPARGPGRPKLGVVAREVTLLPRHWDWLAAQPGGASVALRKLVDAARHGQEGQDRVRRAQEAAYRVMAALAGDRPGFEEASRALFAGDRARFGTLAAAWPADVADYVHRLAEPVFEAR